MDMQGMSEDEAYQVACEQYYAVREEVEMARYVAEEEAAYYNSAKPRNVWTQIGRQKEEEALQKSIKIIRAREEMHASCLCTECGVGDKHSPRPTRTLVPNHSPYIFISRIWQFCPLFLLSRMCSSILLTMGVSTASSVPWMSLM
jgi:hypothetical protein